MAIPNCFCDDCFKNFFSFFEIWQEIVQFVWFISILHFYFFHYLSTVYWFVLSYWRAFLNFVSHERNVRLSPWYILCNASKTSDYKIPFINPFQSLDYYHYIIRSVSFFMKTLTIVTVLHSTFRLWFIISSKFARRCLIQIFISKFQCLNDLIQKSYHVLC